MLHGFADRDEGGEVQHGVDAMFGEDAAQAVLVEQVAFLERPPAHGGTMAAAEVVVDYDAIAGARELLGGVRTDVAGSAGDQNSGLGTHANFPA